METKQTREKRPYAPPALTRLGTAVTLTRGKEDGDWDDYRGRWRYIH